MAPTPDIQIGYVESNIGKSLKRTALEDRSFAESLSTASGLALTVAIVADGIGGENFGERAAQLTIDTLLNSLRAAAGAAIPEILKAALEAANVAVYKESMAEKHKRDMGSTAVVVAVHEGKLYLANVGDSRAYLVRSKQVTQLTFDHSWGNEMMRQGKLRPEEAARHPRRDEVMRSMGYDKNVTVDLGVYVNGMEQEADARRHQGYPLKPGDRLLVCSDGLVKTRPNGRGHFVEPEEFYPAMQGLRPEEAARTLMQTALDRNANDNVSVIVLQMRGGLEFRLPKWVIPAAASAAAILVVAALISAFFFARRGPQKAEIPETIEPGKAFVSEIQGNSVTVAGTQLKLRAFAPSGSLVETGNDSYVTFALGDKKAPITIVVGPNSQLELTDINNAKKDGTVLLTLRNGRVVISPAGTAAVQIFNPLGYFAEVAAKNVVVGLEYDDATQVFDVDCIKGVCRVVGLTDKDTLELKAEQHTRLDSSGLPHAADAYRTERYQFGGLVPEPTATQGNAPAATPSETPLPPIPTATRGVRPTAVPVVLTATPSPAPTLEPPTNTPESGGGGGGATEVPTATRPRPTVIVLPTNTPVPTTPADRDGDGIPDAIDQCPDQPGDVAHNGCPPPPPDTDTPVPPPTQPPATDTPVPPPSPTNIPVPPTDTSVPPTEPPTQPPATDTPPPPF